MIRLINQFQTMQKSNSTAIAILVVFCAMSVGLDRMFLPKTGVLLILLLAVVMICIISNRKIALISSLICALVFNYFFTQPYYSLHMSNVEDIVDTLVFLIIAIITSQFSDTYRQQSEALKQAEMRNRILLSISHDLRTPLSGIIGALTTYQEYESKIEAAQKAELISGALEESNRLHHYVENLLQATKLNHKKLKLTPSTQSIWPILETLIQRFNTPRLQLTKQPGIKQVRVQQSLIEQAIYNLIDNALFFSPKHEPVVIDVSQDQMRTIIDIKDKGPGIQQEQLKQIFDLFYSQRQGIVGDGGSGLGLTVAKGIIDAHHGSLSVLPSKEGCIMRVTLPNHNDSEQ